MKRIIQISFLTLTIITLLTLTGFIINNSRHNDVIDVKVNIYRNAESGFLTQSDILSAINNIDSLILVKSEIEKLKINDIKANIIEKDLLKIPYIDKVDSYLTIDGSLLINIKEKEPIIRIFKKGKGGFYIDNNGDIFPVSKQYAPRVIIANGYIDEKLANKNNNITDTIFNNSVYRDLFRLTKLINQNSLLKAQINQIYVNSKGHFDLIPELGDHQVQVGTMVDISEKLNNLDAFYRKNLKSNDWNKYKTINLTYKGQIVCTKK